VSRRLADDVGDDVFGKAPAEQESPGLRGRARRVDARRRECTLGPRPLAARLACRLERGRDDRTAEAPGLEIGDDLEAAGTTPAQRLGPIARQPGIVDPAELLAAGDGAGGRLGAIADLDQTGFERGRRVRTPGEPARRDVEGTNGSRPGRRIRTCRS
jgi:hypothetical protein